MYSIQSNKVMSAKPGDYILDHIHNQTQIGVGSLTIDQVNSAINKAT